MTEREYDIRAALAKCAAYDPTHFPQSSTAIVEAWLEHFESLAGLTRAEMLDAVRVYYETPDRKVPQPADISHIVRAARRARRDDDEWLAMIEAAGDRKAGDQPSGKSAISGDDKCKRQTAIDAFTAKFGKSPS